MEPDANPLAERARGGDRPAAAELIDLLGVSTVSGKEGGIRLAPRFPQEQQRQLAGMVITPHGTLPVWHLLVGQR